MYIYIYNAVPREGEGAKQRSTSGVRPASRGDGLMGCCVGIITIMISSRSCCSSSSRSSSSSSSNMISY